MAAQGRRCTLVEMRCRQKQGLSVYGCAAGLCRLGCRSLAAKQTGRLPSIC